MTNDIIPFNRPYMSGKELHYISQSHYNGQLAGDGEFTRYCHQWLENAAGVKSALLTHSCTAALEIAALLTNIEPGDEVIMPSYTFVSTANAFVLRGAKPVFVDIREDTLNLDEKLIEQAITKKTKAIVPVHYAGVACEMDEILEISSRHGLMVIEDAAQGVMAKYKGKTLGSIGDLGAYSFHETKNVISGEGGALLVNRADLIRQAEIIREKGTDRSRFFRGEVDKYTWQSVGSSFLPGELIAAFLRAQLEEAETITLKRLKLWDYYDNLLLPLESKGLIRRPHILTHCQHNAHMYYILVRDKLQRQYVLDGLKAQGINAVFHYVPLHSSPAGLAVGIVRSSMHNTDTLSERLIRLPLWIGLTNQQQERVVDVLHSLLLKS